jgi:hypothetical protein
MTNRLLEPPAIPAARPSLRSRWPQWAGYGAAAWSLVYGLLGVYWTRGGVGFPFGVAHDKDARWVSLLADAQPRTAGPVIALLGLAGAALAIAMSRLRSAGRLGAAMSGFAWTMAAGLAVVIPDYRPLLAVVRAPMLLLGAPFGWPQQSVSLTEFFAYFLPWPVANQLLFILGGLLWAAAALAYQRGTRGACGNCGRTDAAIGWTTAGSAARWGRWAVYVAVAIPVLYALTRWAWALDIPLGVTREGLHREARESPGIWLAGAMLATMGAGGAVLTLGLVQRWGEVYPRWIPYLRGKPVRPRTAIIPASAVALLVTSAGLMYVRLLILGRFRLTAETWGLFLPELFWPIWGVALGLAVLAYHFRRRTGCARCGRPRAHDALRSTMAARG